MSQHIFNTKTSKKKKVRVVLGYDRPLDYVFCTVFDEHEEVLYSNLDDDEAGTELQDVDYFQPVLLGLGIRVPEEVFNEVRADQLLRAGNRVVDHTLAVRPTAPQGLIEMVLSRLKAFINRTKRGSSHGR